MLKRDSGKWIRVRAPSGSIVLNVGDYGQRIFNDFYPSTTHRVATPPAESDADGLCRTSFPLNVYLDEDDVLDAAELTKYGKVGEPRYKPVRAEDFHLAITSKYYGDKYKETGTDT